MATTRSAVPEVVDVADLPPAGRRKARQGGRVEGRQAAFLDSDRARLDSLGCIVTEESRLKLEIVSPPRRRRAPVATPSSPSSPGPRRRGPPSRTRSRRAPRSGPRGRAPGDAGSDGSVWTVPLGADGPANRLVRLRYRHGRGDGPRQGARSAARAVRSAPSRRTARRPLSSTFPFSAPDHDRPRRRLRRRSLLVAATPSPSLQERRERPGKLVEMKLSREPWASSPVPRRGAEEGCVEASKVVAMAVFVRDLEHTATDRWSRGMFRRRREGGRKEARREGASSERRRRSRKSRTGGLSPSTEAPSRSPGSSSSSTTARGRGASRPRRQGSDVRLGGISMKPSEDR